MSDRVAGYSTGEIDRYAQVAVTLDVNLGRLMADVGSRAARGRCGKASALSGAIVARRVKVRG